MSKLFLQGTTQKHENEMLKSVSVIKDLAMHMGYKTKRYIHHKGVLSTPPQKKKQTKKKNNNSLTYKIQCMGHM